MPWKHIGILKVELHSFLTSTLEGGEWLKLLSLNLLKPTGYLKHQPVSHSTAVRSAHTAAMCFVFVLKPTANLVLYNIN
jgi:hypothetical protein